MSTSADDQHGPQSSKRRRLNDPRHAWKSADYEDGQAPPWLPAPESSVNHLNQPWESHGILNNLTPAQNWTTVPSSTRSASGRGGQTLSPFSPTPSTRVGYSHLAEIIPLPPSRQATQSSWTFPYGIASSPFHPQTWVGLPGVQQTYTSGRVTMSILPPLSTPMEVLRPAAIYDGREQHAEPNHSNPVSGSDQNSIGLSEVVCFGMVRKLPFSIRLRVDDSKYEYRSNQSPGNVIDRWLQQSLAHF
jgi:hypothetical protein